jgi:mannose/fructose/N-acetylgalactosamine-specific phosphotransferase system component IIB
VVVLQILIILIRIDDRLIHAQVVIGWGRALSPDRIVVADDAVASTEWEKNLYLTATPAEIRVSILSIEQTMAQLSGGVFDQERIILLVRAPQSIVRLMELGLMVDEVNIGGLHYREGRKRYLDFVCLDEQERQALRELVKRGVTLEARALPGHEPVILNSRVV